MAIVADRSGNTLAPTGVDRPYTTPNRKNAGSPVGSLTPQYSGEVVLDSTTGDLWFATDLTNTGWAPATIGN